jgi:hypothetical protein
MEFVFGRRNASRLSETLTKAMETSEYVDAAIAYVTAKDTLIAACISKNVPLRLYARYDYTQPVAYEVLRWFFTKNSANYTCALVPDIFHPKIIWWHGYGAYIGSANLTTSAWFNNYEAGLFLTEEEMEEEGVVEELAEYFLDIKANSTPLNAQIVEAARLYTSSDNPYFRSDNSAKARFEETRLIPRLKNLASVDKVNSRTRYKNEFLKEWNSTIGILQQLSNLSADYRPAWVKDEVPDSILVDRFLHDFYYHHVKEGAKHPYEDFYRKNFKRPAEATIEALENWRDSSAPSDAEVKQIHEWWSFLRPLLSEDRLAKLSESEFEQVFAKVNAVRDHAMRVSWKSYGLDKRQESMKQDERVSQFSEWVYRQQSEDGSTSTEILHYVIYGGPTEFTPDRIFDCGYRPRKIAHMGVSTFGEIVGLAKPDYSPPRNGRTSKALRALGYDVAVHSGA